MTIYIIVKRAENWVIGISQDLSTPNKRGNNGGEAFDNDDNDDNDDDGDDDYDDDDDDASWAELLMSHLSPPLSIALHWWWWW